jgi:hypothetical protein
MNFVTRKSLPRRTFLKSALGTAIALPMLDSMIPALTAAPKATPRLGWIYISNGIILEDFIPKHTGKGFDLPPILKPFEPHRDYINVLTGLQQKQADTQGDGTGDHPRAAAAWLTGVHAYDRSQPGVEVKLATTADQLAAHQIGKTTQLPSLEISIDTPPQGACDSGDCFYVNTVSWLNESTPNSVETQPRLVFERLFGDGGSAAERQERVRNEGSILDSVTAEATRLAGTLGRNDQRKFSEYLDSVRDIEKRIRGAEVESQTSLVLPDRPVGIPASFDDYANMMFDLTLLAYRADLTRVFTFIISRELSTRAYPQIDVPESHHGVSHHRNDPVLIAKKSRIDVYHAQLFSRFVQKMKETPDGEGSLLDNSLLLYGSGMGDGNLHRHQNLPNMLVGKQGGLVKTGYHLSFPDEPPMTNLLLTMMDTAGVNLDKLGDSTGHMKLEPLGIA